MMEEDLKLALMHRKNIKKNQYYKKLVNEAKTLCNMLTYISTGKLHVSFMGIEKDSIVIVIESGDIINVPLARFCSKEWKIALLTNPKLRYVLDEYDDGWYKNNIKLTGKIMQNKIMLMLFGITLMVIKRNLPLASVSICLAGLFVMLFSMIIDAYIRISRIKEIKKSVDNIKEQIFEMDHLF